jgi:predicted outer membrane protein
MKKRSILLAGCGLFASLVFVGAAQAQSAQEFVNTVAISDMFEIQSSRLALARQPDKDTKPFAEKMVRDHQKTGWMEAQSRLIQSRLRLPSKTVVRS